MKLPVLEIGKLRAPVPIVQGGMAVRISLAPLAAAVANEGGIGLIAASGIHPPEVSEQIKKAKRLTDGIVGINVMVAVKEFKDIVTTAIHEKVDLIVAGAGFSRDIFILGKENNVPIVPIVSSERVARLAEKFGASAIVVEGKEAGGHLGTDKPLLSILPGIINSVKIPVIAAGGILKGSDIARVLSMGAKGVQMGTRFAASDESSAASAWKEAYVNAKAEDVVIIESPVGMPGRALRTKFVKDLFANKVPTFKDIKKCVTCLKHCKRNYCIMQALESARMGDLEKGLIFCGERVGEINDILPVKKIIANLIKEFNESVGGAKECPEEL
ncbi:nitronate monooxygenase [Candidatus Oleimmundimicrobium sp.]|uniref:NAD(P)H-dependent flavin oxidoreductase n=1 Tax=Candidatus Oleimmundimicrobium sp. TaxID=3060597 RepID=UPI00272436D8|nr:nitronate monooxygenase [Candidatus Oleimmundimicrobium sp.]MDO8885356.1 nitronate monooxygenase [Candidatus Oleimmundimicrobium sp.]